jgi:alkyl sulfatase BDS1-like metallo-beta-lactamase superfamily hydrolase
VKAVYQRYLSWYDGNPANLWKLPPSEVGERYVALAGGPAALLAAARRSFDDGDYRWVAELVNHLVFADPTDAEARELQADALEQLGYQCESATFRNAYLYGAHELRNGHPPRRDAMRQGMLRAMTVAQLFDALAVRLRAEELGGVSGTVALDFVDVGETWTVGVSNRALHATRGRSPSAAIDASATVDRQLLIELSGNETTLADAITSRRFVIHGDPAAFDAVLGHLDSFQSMFPVVEP